MERTKVRGRPRIDSIIPIEKMVEVFLESRSMADAAKTLGISARTMKRELVLARVNTDKPRKHSHFKSETQKPWEVDFKSAAHTWFKENPDNLIHSPAALAKIIGCSQRLVRDYFYKKRVALEMFLQTLGNLRECDGKLVTIRGDSFFCRFITDYTLRVDPVSLVITIKGFTSAAGTFTSKIGFIEYCKMFGRRVDPRSFFRGAVK